MNLGLLLWERIVLESVSKGIKKLEEISQDTSITLPVLEKIVKDLVFRNILKEESENYTVSEDFSTEESLIQEEVKDVFSSMVGLYYKEKSQIKLKKIYLTPEELKIFQMQLYSLEGFLEKISKLERKIRLCEQRVFVWGHAPYAHLLDEF